MPDQALMALHVGGMKTGSSALQHALTWSPIRPLLNSAQQYEYASLLPGQLLRGERLGHHASCFAAHYSMSDQLDNLVRQSPAAWQAGHEGLAAIYDEGRIPILSYETWLTTSRPVIHEFTERLRVPLHVVAYVRPPVTWLASLFYQKYKAKIPRDKWVARKISRTFWADFVETWADAPGVEKISVRLHTADICTDFCNLLGCQPGQTLTRHNQCWPAMAAEFLERVDIPEGISGSELKFALWRWLEARQQRTADLTITPRSAEFPFTAEEVKQIQEQTIDASQQLLSWCTAEIRDQITADPRWWSEDFSTFAETAPAVQQPKTNGAEHPKHAPGDEFALLLWQCLLEADSAWRTTQAQLSSQQHESKPPQRRRWFRW